MASTNLMIWQTRVQYLTEAGNYFSRNIVCMFSFLLLIIILRHDINSFVWLRVYFNIVHIKSMEHRRIEQALILVYNSIYNQAPNYIREMFLLRSNGYSLRGHLKVVLPRPTSSYMQHSFTYQAGKQWNNLPDKIRMSESLSIFRKNLQNIQLSSSYDCNCVFCK